MGSIAPVLECPACHRSNPHGHVRCTFCSTLLSSSGGDGDLNATVEDWTALAGAPVPAWSPTSIPPGTVLADRYEILQLLGQGGMGVAYKAKDRELDRIVALKVIRPELADQPRVLHRFKQELILAR